MYRWLKFAQRVILPSYCLLCHAPTAEDHALCPPCRAELAWLAHACRHCALPIAADATSALCAHCRKTPRFDAAIAACHYDAAVRWLVTGLKFRTQLAHADLLAGLIADRLALAELARPDLLVPVPLHVTHFRARGFNQAERIARRLAPRIGVPMRADIVVRTRKTARQSELKAAARAANVRGAFACTATLTDRHVAIVDDVLTTTRTAGALARELRRAGARRVDCYSVARA